MQLRHVEHKNPSRACLEMPQVRTLYYHLQNLRKWCRENEHLFDHENHIAKLPIALAYTSGISNLKRTGCSYHGWTLVAQGQHEAQVMGYVHNKDYPEHISG